MKNGDAANLSAVRRLKYVADLNPTARQDLLEASDTEVSFLPMEAIGEDGSIKLGQMRPVSDVRNGYSYFEDGDVAFAKVTPCFENGKGALMSGLERGAGLGTTELTVLRARQGTSAQFLNYVVQSSRFRQFGAAAMTGAGGLKRVPDEFTRDFKTSWPSLTDQTRIANFLDEQTARIDALIAEKERLDVLLGEYRQAVIAQAVTKGLDANAPIKDSGIEWLGAVPEHWERWKVSHAFGRIGSGTTPPTDQQEWYEDGNIPWITTGELRENRIEQTAKSVTAAALEKFSALQVFPPESLAVAMYGATIGRLGILGTDATTNQACCVLSLPAHLAVPFVFYWLCAFRQVLIALFATGGGQPNISQDSVASLRVPAPSLKEQAAIANFLDEHTARIDALREHCKKHIALLREYRSSLISAAVTGQLDIDNFGRPEA